VCITTDRKELLDILADTQLVKIVYLMNFYSGLAIFVSEVLCLES
jgi:hypothetical protein